MFRKIQASLERRLALFRLIGTFTLLKIGLTRQVNAQSSYFLPGYLINLYLKHHFPLSKQWLIVKIDLREPEMGFLPQEQRLTLFSKTTLTLLDRKSLNGHLHCSSGFIYDNEKKTIRLKNPTIEQMSVEGLGQKETNFLQQINAWVAKWLDGLTVYEFKADENGLLKKSPKQIVIEESGIRILF